MACRDGLLRPRARIDAARKEKVDPAALDELIETREASMKGMTRRRLLRNAAGASAGLALPWGVRAPSANAAAGGNLRKYVQALPVPGKGIVVADGTNGGSLAFTQRPISKQLHPDLPDTPIWAYDHNGSANAQAGSFGLAVIAQSGMPLTVSFTHALPTTYPPWLPVDTRLTPLGNQVRVMTHLHGGFVAADSDGNPAVTPEGFGHGETQTVFYTNQQPQMPASLLWFHDHALGATRLNVVAGLAAAYILRDEHDTGHETGEHANKIGIPGDGYEIPLVIQDRQFNSNGTFLYPTSDIGDDVVWIGEYFGDVMLVNGKVWPFLDVEPRMYRFRILNGCNARILNLDIPGARMWQIGAEGGMWDAPVHVTHLVLAPAERADVLVDFSNLAGVKLLMTNHKPTHPVSTPAPSLKEVMQIRVGTNVIQPGPKTVPASLPGRAADLPEPDPSSPTRFITLNEIAAETADWHLNLNGMPFLAAATETPVPGTVEDWVYINLTGDTHPMHTHLVTFQVVGRTPFNADAYQAAHFDANGVPGGFDPTPFARGPMRPADPTERGFKDTVKANPGEFTTIRAKFDLPKDVTAPQTYVYHCHILEHEDNDMMRPFTVMFPASAPIATR
jgi:spore coat protein A